MPPSVLLVEDSPFVRRALRRQLEAAGLAVAAECASELQALQWLDAHAGAWDLAIVDLVLEQGTGMAVIAAAKAQPGAGNVAVYTAYVTPEVSRHCLKLGADAVLRKGSDAAALAQFCGVPAPHAGQARKA